jgi:hypothetical protein
LSSRVALEAAAAVVVEVVRVDSVPERVCP